MFTSGKENPLNGEPIADPNTELAGVDGKELNWFWVPSSPSGNLMGVNPEAWLNGNCEEKAWF